MRSKTVEFDPEKLRLMNYVSIGQLATLTGEQHMLLSLSKIDPLKEDCPAENNCSFAIEDADVFADFILRLCSAAQSIWGSDAIKINIPEHLVN